MTSTPEADLIELARRLLTPACPITDDDETQTTRSWVEGRIRWHRLYGNDALADELLREENAVRRALDKPEIEA